MAKCKLTSKDKRLKIAKGMPPLRRKLPNKSYSYKNDQVMDWISKRPALIDYVLDKLVANGYIVYDPKLKLWYGVDYFEENED